MKENRAIEAVLNPERQNETWKERLLRSERGEKVEPFKRLFDLSKMDQIKALFEAKQPDKLAVIISKAPRHKLQRIVANKDEYPGQIAATPESREAIKALKQIGEEAEDYLIDILKNGGLGFEVYENVITPVMLRQAEKSAPGGKLPPALIRAATANYYCSICEKYFEENKLILDALSEMGTEKSVDFAIEVVKAPVVHGLYRDELLKIVNRHKDLSLSKLEEMFKGNIEHELWRRLELLLYTDIAGAEQAINRLLELVDSEGGIGDETAVKNLEFAHSLITPFIKLSAEETDPVKIEHISNLQKMYEQLNFKEYALNAKVNEEELRLLTEELKDEGGKPVLDKSGKILDIGCGTGRLLIPLHQAGYDITGFDYTGKHARVDIPAEDKTVKIFQGDWHNMGLKDGAFDTAYSLGRNILHDYSIADQIQLFREAARVLKPGGRFIFDIPDRKKGAYAESIRNYKDYMEKQGIRNFREGTVYDSPNGELYTTRYCYSREDIEELAVLAGFRVVSVTEKDLPTGKGDVDWYFVLEKRAGS